MIVKRFHEHSRWHLEIECETCGAHFQRQERVYKKQAEWRDSCRSCAGRVRKFGVPARGYLCADCRKPVWYGSTKCKSCAQKNPDRFCCDCQKQIGSKGQRLRCLPCHNQQQNKGKSRERTLFNVSAGWREARTACFERDNYTCQECGERGGFLHAHHIRSYRDHPKLRLDVGNLQTMCRDCHNDHHGLTRKAA